MENRGETVVSATVSATAFLQEFAESSENKREDGENFSTNNSSGWVNKGIHREVGLHSAA
jgi:hypothetical protein